MSVVVIDRLDAVGDGGPCIIIVRDMIFDVVHESLVGSDVECDVREDGDGRRSRDGRDECRWFDDGTGRGDDEALLLRLADTTALDTNVEANGNE